MRALGAVTALLVVIGGAVAYLNIAASDVTVTNEGRTSIGVRGRLPAGAEALLAAVGVRNLPDELAPGAPVTLRIPNAFGGTIDATTPGEIAVIVFGQAARFQGRCDSLSLDGVSLLGQRTVFSVGQQPTHELRLACG